MSAKFDAVFGWTESRFNSAVTVAGDPGLVVAGKANYVIKIRRIRGTSDQDLTLKQGTTAAGSVALPTPVIQSQENFDIPGLELTLDEGNSLYVDVAADTTPDINVQYAYVRSSHTGNFETN